MTDSDNLPIWPPPRPPDPAGRNGCVTAILVLVGVVLLLPGFCTIAFFRGGLHQGMGLIALITSVVGLGGLALIVFALARSGR